MLIIASSAVMQPIMATTDARTPWRALTLMMSSILGPGVAETTKVMATKSHQVLKVMESLQLSQRVLRLAEPAVDSLKSPHDPNSNTTTTIATHSGSFHADDVFGVGVLMGVFPVAHADSHPQARVD